MCAAKYKLKTVRDNLDSQNEEAFERTDVSEILKENTANHEAGKDWSVTERKSRRKRDYIALMILVNLLLLIPIILQPANIFVVACCVSGMVVLSGGLTWILWGVMSDY